MKRLMGDLRALGWWAPLRIAYEITRRAGVTGRVLMARFSRMRTVPDVTSSFSPSSLLLQEGDVEAGNGILSGTVAIFGTDVGLNESPDWHASDVGEPWPAIPWWRIPIRPADGRDVKYVYEIGRHVHLVTLARAAASVSEPADYIERLESHLISWFDQSPPEVGIHWSSNLEISLRALSWLQVVGLVGDLLGREVRAEISRHLFHSGRHIVAELPYTVSSMRNNHLIGDAVGLVAIGKAFPDDRRARRWVRMGDRLLRRHVPHHVNHDGSSIEDSLGYRCFVLELLAARVALGNPPSQVQDALGCSARHLGRLGASSGSVPRFGDWDGGGAMAGRLPPPGGSMATAEVIALEALDAAPVRDGEDAGGGIGRIVRGPWTVWLKNGAGSSHGHADMLSVSILHGEQWTIGDPGNGSYNRSMEERDYFRTSVAHSVLRIDGLDQRVPHRRFRWRYDPESYFGTPFSIGKYRVMWGRHSAYSRLDPARTIVRACVVSTDAVVIADWIAGGSTPWALSLPLSPDVTFDDLRPDTIAALILPDGTDLGLALPGTATARRGTTEPYDGWWAEDYGIVRPATRLEVSGSGSGPVTWALWSGVRPDVRTDGANLVIDGFELRTTRQTDGEITVEAGKA